MSNIPACLFGAGALGHTWVGTRFDGVDGSERIVIQASYGADVVRSLDEYKDGVSCPSHIYERVGRIKRTGTIVWRKRTRGFALLDQPTDGRLPYEPDMEEAQS